MKKFLIIVILLNPILGCSSTEDGSSSKPQNLEKVWAFFQFNVPEEDGGLESYYYYGQIFKKDYQSIVNNVPKKFVLLQNVKYWSEDDMIHDYKDGENSGEIVFKVENIMRIRLIIKEPIAGKGLEQFEEKQKETDSFASEKK